MLNIINFNFVNFFKNYYKLYINPKKWDYMIKSYKLESLEELIIFAIDKAKIYREKCNNCK